MLGCYEEIYATVLSLERRRLDDAQYLLVYMYGEDPAIIRIWAMIGWLSGKEVTAPTWRLATSSGGQRGTTPWARPPSFHLSGINEYEVKLN